MKVLSNHIIFSNPLKLYDISNIECMRWINGYWKEYKHIRDSSFTHSPFSPLRKLISCFVKEENVELSWSKYYLVLRLRQNFHLSYPSLLHYPKVSKTLTNALISPEFVKDFRLIPKGLIGKTIKDLEKDGEEEIKKINIEENWNEEFFTRSGAKKTNIILERIYNMTKEDEQKVINNLTSRLEDWENYKERTINLRLYSLRQTNFFNYCFNSELKKFVSSYAAMYMSKIEGLL